MKRGRPGGGGDGVEDEIVRRFWIMEEQEPPFSFLFPFSFFIQMKRKGGLKWKLERNAGRKEKGRWKKGKIELGEGANGAQSRPRKQDKRDGKKQGEDK